MKTTVAAVGIIVLLIGLGVTAYGLSTPLNSTSQNTVVVNPNITRDIDAGGTWSAGAAVLSRGEAVTGTFTISNYSSSAGPIFLYIQNQSEFIAWGSCAPCTSPSLENWTLPSSGTYSFTWTVPYSSSFYVSFDNEYYTAVAPAVYWANGTTTASATGRNTTYVDSGAGLLVIGAIIFAVGVLMTGRKKTSGKVAVERQNKPPAPTTSPIQQAMSAR